MKDKNQYKPGTIGYAWAEGEQAGRDAWLAGIPFECCPYTAYEDTMERGGWLLGWTFMQHDFEKMQKEQNNG